ncbi:hypothetical protein H2198_003751 [Neophaeococcomyces mojaviensis]|uniref:Uncharacterized protein n=1 Tax=Neophaeococcomyces mojaviensis TaxID=3383035 RepID=A0ACC3AAS8_9EURO|nr:hypothetical protein H2198_003751 [Knufia sp. JES_112]
MAVSMLSSPNHETWQNNEFETYVQDNWNANAHDFRDCVISIETILDLVASGVSGVDKSLTDTFPQHLENLKDNIDDLKVLLKQCVPQHSDQENSSKSLRTTMNSNYTFGENSTFNGPMFMGNEFKAQGSISFGVPAQSHPNQAKLEIGRSRHIQQAATQLYRAFGLACGEHHTHYASLKLTTSSDHISQIQFTLIMQHYGVLTAPGGEERMGSPVPLLLRIESHLMGTISRTLTPPDNGHLAHISDVLPHRLKRKIDELNTRVIDAQQESSQDNSNATHEQLQNIVNDHVSSKKLRRCVKSVTFADTEKTLFEQEEANHRTTELPVLPNFCDNNDFCRYIDVTFRERCIGNDYEALGYLLDCPGSLRHSIYISSELQHSNSRRTRLNSSHGHLLGGSSLKQLTRSRNRDGALSMVDWVMVEKQLATAVMQFHATPWLEQYWDSDHVLVKKTPSETKVRKNPSLGTSQQVNSYESYLEVTIEKTDNLKLKQPLQKSTAFVQNPTLFRFGVMLLESAYGRSLRELQRPMDKDPYGDRNTEYYTAMRLLENVSKKVGWARANIIRKCIDFSKEQGFDLQSIQSQERYYEGVVEQLDFVEQRFRDLGL